MRSPTSRVVALTAGLTVLAVGLAVSGLRGAGELSIARTVPWWVLAAGFLCTEVFTIHVDLRRDTYSISMMELPLVVGLFFVSPLAVLGARLVGSSVAFAVDRDRVLLKTAFNLALYSAETAVAIVVFRSVLTVVDPSDPRAWVAAFAAMLAANVVSVLGVMGVMRLHGAPLEGRVPAMVRGALIPPVATTSLALAAVSLLWTDPTSAWLLAGVAAVLVAAYRGYAGLNHRYANLQRLYEFTRRVQADGDVTSLDELLRATADVMRAAVVELTLLEEDAARVARISDGTVSEEDVALDALDPLVGVALAEDRAVLVSKHSRDHVRRDLARARGWRDCVALSMTTGKGARAVMLVADRDDDVSTFDRDDIRLFEALVNHCAIALDNAQLVSRLRHDALHDALTALPNRTLFHTQVGEAIANRTVGTKLAVLLMDLDRFKEVNDTLGHHFGDQLLVEVGRRLAQIERQGGAVARLGGDEFALVVPHVTDDLEALDVARGVRALLDEPFHVGEFDVDVDGTIGIALSPDHGEDAATLLQRADVAMYAAKRDGGIAVYTAERDHYSPRRLSLVSELREAIEHDAFVLHYQAKVSVETGETVGAEALLRWPHPTRGVVPPDEFIPIAEQTGLIRPLTVQVLRRAALDCAQWRAAGFDIGVAVNISARNLVDVDLIERLRPLLLANELPPQSLTIEITESSIMGDINRTMAVLDELSRIGVRIAIDDFGTGYSSLTYLKRLPVDEVKVDKSFVQTMLEDPGDAAIVRSVVELGHNLGMTVVAEGVESEEALAALRATACSQAQGFLFHRPASQEAFLEHLRAQPRIASDAKARLRVVNA